MTIAMIYVYAAMFFALALAGVLALRLREALKRLELERQTTYRQMLALRDYRQFVQHFTEVTNTKLRIVKDEPA